MQVVYENRSSSFSHFKYSGFSYKDRKDMTMGKNSHKAMEFELMNTDFINSFFFER